jgi:hypothetical protein
MLPAGSAYVPGTVQYSTRTRAYPGITFYPSNAQRYKPNAIVTSPESQEAQNGLPCVFYPRNKEQAIRSQVHSQVHVWVHRCSRMPSKERQGALGIESGINKKKKRYPSLVGTSCSPGAVSMSILGYNEAFGPSADSGRHPLSSGLVHYGTFFVFESVFPFSRISHEISLLPNLISEPSSFKSLHTARSTVTRAFDAAAST